jgi:hypothetical protein
LDPAKTAPPKPTSTPDAAANPPAPEGNAPPPGAPPAADLGPRLTEANARIELLVGEKADLETKLAKSQGETFEQKEEVARLQTLLSQMSRSQLPALGEGAFELGDAVTIMGAAEHDGEPARVHAVAGDVLAVNLKPASLKKLKETLKGKARVWVIDESMLAELRELKLLRN